MRTITSLTFLVGSVCVSFAGEVEDAYAAGYQAGYAAGYGAGTTFSRGTTTSPSSRALQPSLELGRAASGTVMIPGSKFDVVIDPIEQKLPFEFTPDSSVAIIPKAAVDQIQQKMGADFIQKNMMLNNATPAQ